MKKILCSLMVIVMFISSLSVSASADFGFGNVNLETGEVSQDEADASTVYPTYQPQDIGNLKGFSDLGGHEWARPAIEDMSIGTYKGLFSGKTAPNEQGLAQFDPNGQMSRAEFITVVTRALYSEVLANMPGVSGEYWYSNNYDVAVDNNLITENEYPFTSAVLNAPMPRQEMALILTRACEQMGESTGTLVSTSRISDYNTVGGYYKEAVRVAFTKGLIAGKDDTGRFDPQGTLTRAEGATVLYRLVNESKRVDVTPNGGNYIIDTGSGTQQQGPTENVSGPITIYEGQARYNRNAKAGDTFVKKDGTKIVLKLDQYGVLGGGQGVAPDVGLLGQINEKGCLTFTYKVVDYGVWVDSSGLQLQNQTYYVNQTTGEGYWGGELKLLRNGIGYPSYDGTQVGEVSKDSYHLYKWDGGDWIMNFDKLGK
ncbi:MAG: S-layer homology domain-containing protein [Ruminococcaceae bacterium]|nr:S-layer homology domain-containing protein [Oscillospiraceae bacterium]